jgi:putative transferase (TIGR04331 family)
MIKWNSRLVALGLKKVTECEGEILHELKRLLDDYHHWERSASYYDTVMGDWLLHFTHQVYVAWQEVLTGNIPTINQSIPVSSDLTDAFSLCWQGNTLHDHLQWAVASLLEGGSASDWQFERESVVIVSGRRKSVSLRIVQFISTSKPVVLVTAPYFKCSKLEWLSALWRWRCWLAWDDIEYPIRISSQLDFTWRKAQATTTLPVTNLTELVQVLLPLHLPVALLEGFAEYRKAVLAFPVPRPKAVYSANALHSHLAWKLLVAEWRQFGTLLLYHQHGGGYGIDYLHSIEEYETRVVDCYYTFGWSSEQPHVKPLSSPPINASPSRPRKRLLLSCLDMPQFVYRLHFHPMLGTIETLHRETCKFLTQLPDRRQLLVRPYPQDYGWGAVGMMRKVAPDAEFDDHKKSSAIRYAESRLVIHNYLGTGWLETLALDIPTVCFYDPEAYAFREAAQSYIDALETVGVLHCSGNSAGLFVASLGDDIEKWWAKVEVQEARRNFVKQYANFSPDWKEQWEQEFKAVLDIIGN